MLRHLILLTKMPRVHVESSSAKLFDVASKSVNLDDVAADVITKV